MTAQVMNALTDYLTSLPVSAALSFSAMIQNNTQFAPTPLYEPTRTYVHFVPSVPTQTPYPASNPQVMKPHSYWEWITIMSAILVASERIWFLISYLEKIDRKCRTLRNLCSWLHTGQGYLYKYMKWKLKTAEETLIDLAKDSKPAIRAKMIEAGWDARRRSSAIAGPRSPSSALRHPCDVRTESGPGCPSPKLNLRPVVMSEVESNAIVTARDGRRFPA